MSAQEGTNDLELLLGAQIGDDSTAVDPSMHAPRNAAASEHHGTFSNNREGFHVPAVLPGRARTCNSDKLSRPSNCQRQNHGVPSCTAEIITDKSWREINNVLRWGSLRSKL